jgi:hemerythrin-like metal-binding protein
MSLVDTIEKIEARGAGWGGTMSEPINTNERSRELQAEAMEAQHELLTSLMNSLAHRDSAGATKIELSQLLRQLESLTASHFKEEETYMRELAHPKLETHQIIHRDLLIMLRGHMDEFEAGDGRLGCKLRSFLVYWLGSHIEGMDRQLTNFSRPLRRHKSGPRSSVRSRS